MAKKLYEVAFEIGGKLNSSLPRSVFTAAGQLGRLGKSIAALEKSQGTATRFRSLHKEISATKLNLRQAESAFRQLDAQMRASENPPKALAQKHAEARAKVAALRQEFKAQGAELRQVNAAMAAAGIRARSFAADTASLAARVARARRVQRNLREVQGAVEANKSRVSALKSRVLPAVAATAAFVIPVKIAARFEDAMVRVGALARASDSDLAKLTETARKLGRDTRFSATQAAEGMQFLAMAGFQTSEIIGTMPGMLDLAAAGAIDLASASDITSNILRGFNMRAEETGRLGDVLTNTFTQSNTDLRLLGDTMKYVAPIAKATGVSLEMTAAAAGLLGNAGIKGEQAGTAMRAMLSRLAAPMRKGQKALAMLKVATKDAKGNLRPFADVLVDLNKKLSKFGSATRQAAITHIFGMEAATAATVLIGEAGSGNLQKFAKAVARSGTAAEVAAKQNATMAGQWAIIKSATEDLAIQLGNILIPALKQTVDFLVPVINRVTQWAQENPALSSTIFAVAAGLAVANLAIVGLGVPILTVVGVLLKMKLAFTVVQAAMIGANGAMLVTVGYAALVVAGVAGIAYAAKNLKDNWNVVGQWWDELWDGMLDKVAGIWNKLPTPIRWMISRFAGGGIDTKDMVRGNVASNFGPRAQLADFLAKDAKARKANLDAFTSEGAAPSWLKRKNPVEAAPDWLTPRFAKTEKLSRSSRSQVTFAPQIHLAPGASKDAREGVEKGMQTAQKDFEKMLQSLADQQERLSFD